MPANLLLAGDQEGRGFMYTQSGGSYSVRTDRALVVLARLLAEIATNSTPEGVSAIPEAAKAPGLVLADDTGLSSTDTFMPNSNRPNTTKSRGKVRVATNLVPVLDSTPSLGGSI